MAQVQEQYSPRRIAANGTLALTPSGGGCTRLGGFFCTTAGNVKIAEAADGSGTDIVSVFGALVGVFYPLPFTFTSAAAIVLSGGAAGTVAVNFE